MSVLVLLTLKVTTTLFDHQASELPVLFFNLIRHCNLDT